MAEGQTREMRGVWYTPRVGGNFATQSQIAAAMDTIRSNNFNTVLFNVWSQGYPLYRSQAFFEATNGWGYTDPKAGSRDLLAEAVLEAHRRGLEIEAWFEYGFIGGYSGNKPAGYRRSVLIDAHPNWLGRSSGGIDSVGIGSYAHYWMSNEHAEVKTFLIDLSTEIADGYDVDGIELDRVRYPTDRQTDWGYDSATVATYFAEKGTTPPAIPSDVNWMRWRADKLNAFQHAAYDSIKAHNPNVLVTNAPAHYSSSAYYAGYETYLQDWAAWINGGYLDAAHLQQYVSTASGLNPYISSWKTYRVTDPAKQQIVFPGIAVSPNGSQVPAAEFLSIVQTIRSAGLKGQATWYFEDLNLLDGGKSYWSHLKSGPYAQYVETPLRATSDWRVPATIVSDYDTTAGGATLFTKSGSWTRLTTVYGYSGRVYTSTSTGLNSVTYSGRVPVTAWYDVYAYVVGGSFRTTRAPYDIYDSSGVRRVLVDQSNANTLGWQLLGKAFLNSDSLRTIVRLSNDSIGTGLGVNTGGIMLIINRKLSPSAQTTSVQSEIRIPPSAFAVSNAYPNPFNPTTVISYQLSVVNGVDVRVYDLLGREVAMLMNEVQTPGHKEVRWNANGRASGIYFIRVQAGANVRVVKCMLLK